MVFIIDYKAVLSETVGTTALLNFLTLNPLLMANQPLPGTFEEVQFFSLDQRYERGVEWSVHDGAPRLTGAIPSH